MEEKEVFKDIPSFEGYYQVSNLGNVKSCERVDGAGRLRPSRMMTKTLTNGYPTVKLSKDGISKRYSIHRLVAESFIPNIENKPFIDHKNADRCDNRVENLRWCTPLENALYCMELNRHNDTKNSELVGSKKVAKLDLEGNEICVYPSLGEAHRQNPKASVSKISAVCRGKRTQTAGFKWEFRSDNSYSNLSHVFGKSKPISMTKGNLISHFKSLNEAHNKTMISFCAIRRSLEKGLPTWDGYLFSYD